MSRALASFEPVWLGDATGRGAEPPGSSSAPDPLHPRSAELGVGGRRQIAEPAVWPDCVVVILENGEHLPRMGERGEQRLIEQLVAKAPVEALDESILLRLPGCDVVPFDPGLL